MTPVFHVLSGVALIELAKAVFKLPPTGIGAALVVGNAGIDVDHLLIPGFVQEKQQQTREWEAGKSSKALPTQERIDNVCRYTYLHRIFLVVPISFVLYMLFQWIQPFSWQIHWFWYAVAAVAYLLHTGVDLVLIKYGSDWELWPFHEKVRAWVLRRWGRRRPLGVVDNLSPKEALWESPFVIIAFLYYNIRESGLNAEIAGILAIFSVLFWAFRILIKPKDFFRITAQNAHLSAFALAIYVVAIYW